MYPLPKYYDTMLLYPPLGRRKEHRDRPAGCAAVAFIAFSEGTGGSIEQQRIGNPQGTRYVALAYREEVGATVHGELVATGRVRLITN